MTIIKHCQGQPAAESKTSSVNAYRIPVICHSDDEADDGGIAINYLYGHYPYGSSYSQPNYVDPFSIVKRITARRRKDSANPWIFDCVVHYDPATPSAEFEDEDGNYVEDPLQWRLAIDSTVRPRTLPVWQAKNVDAYPRTPETWKYTRAAGTTGPVVNSAGTILDPPLMKTISDRVLRISGNLAFYNEALLDAYQDKLNSATMYWSETMLNKYAFAGKKIDPLTCLCSLAIASYQRINNQGFYRYTYEFIFKDRDPTKYPINNDPYGPSFEGDGHLHSVLDRGVSIRHVPGSPDGEGGTVPGSPGTGFADGIAEVRATPDKDGKRIPEKVLLDGSGMPAKSSDSLAPKGVWFRYQVDGDVIMTGHPFGIFQTDDPNPGP